MRARERALNFEEMRQVVNYHDKKRQQSRGAHGGFIYKYEKSADGVNLVVVAESKKNEHWLITGWRC